jgi:hypothetical protein
MVNKMKESDRMRQWRSKKEEEGGRSLSLWLEPETAKQLNELRRHFGRSKGGRNKPIISKAIRDLHEAIFNK